MSFPAAIIVEGVVAQPAAAAQMARTRCPRPTAAVAWGPGHTGNVGAAHKS